MDGYFMHIKSFTVPKCDNQMTKSKVTLRANSQNPIQPSFGFKTKLHVWFTTIYQHVWIALL